MEESNNPLRIEDSVFIDVADLDEFFFEIDPELVYRLEEELAEALDKIRRYPERGSFYEEEIRRFGFASFPCYVFYEAEETETVIYAIAHEHESPGRISQRLEQNL
ncbi:MAG: hypothetical protein P1V97_14660 [Planctomycetota bacterium]|nr:hypothetical protein [Planctomycetota bacterium]